LVWDIKTAQVHLVKQGCPTDRTYWLIVAWNRVTDEYKYFVSNASPQTEPTLLLKVAFRRAVVEHLFRLAKGEAGLGHFEGRSYVGLMRHMILCQLVVLFLAEQTQRINAEMAAALPADTPRGEKITRQEAGFSPGAHDASDPSAGYGPSPAARHHGADRSLAELAVCPVA
jgi:hypothetical protein